MSVKDTLKKKVAPIAVAAATLLTPVATQGAEKPEAEQNPQKMEQIQKKKLTRDEKIDELVSKKKVPEEDVKIMRKMAQDLDSFDSVFGQTKELLKKQGVDYEDLGSNGSIDVVLLKNGNLVVMIKKSDEEFAWRAKDAEYQFIEFDRLGRVVVENRFYKGDYVGFEALANERVWPKRKTGYDKMYTVHSSGNRTSILCRDEKGDVFYATRYNNGNERVVYYSPKRRITANRVVEFEDEVSFSKVNAFGEDLKVKYKDLEQPKEKNLLQSAVQNRVLGR